MSAEDIDIAVPTPGSTGSRSTVYRGQCPHCGSSLVERSGPYGPFLACAAFPETGCEYTVEVGE